MGESVFKTSGNLGVTDKQTHSKILPGPTPGTTYTWNVTICFISIVSGLSRTALVWRGGNIIFGIMYLAVISKFPVYTQRTRPLTPKSRWIRLRSRYISVLVMDLTPDLE